MDPVEILGTPQVAWYTPKHDPSDSALIDQRGLYLDSAEQPPGTETLLRASAAKRSSERLGRPCFFWPVARPSIRLASRYPISFVFVCSAVNYPVTR